MTNSSSPSAAQTQWLKLSAVVDLLTRLRESCQQDRYLGIARHLDLVIAGLEQVEAALAADPVQEDASKDFDALLADLREIESLYNTDRISHFYASSIEKIFDRWLYESRSPDGGGHRETRAVAGDSVDTSAQSLPPQQAHVHAREGNRIGGVTPTLTDERLAGSEPADSLTPARVVQAAPASGHIADAVVDLKRALALLDVENTSLDERVNRALCIYIEAALRAINKLAGEAEQHRCAKCGHRWEGGTTVAELCGDCWRAVQAASASQPAHILNGLQRYGFFKAHPQRAACIGQTAFGDFIRLSDALAALALQRPKEPTSQPADRPLQNRELVPHTALGILARETVHAVEKATEHPPFVALCSNHIERIVYNALLAAARPRDARTATARLVCARRRTNRERSAIPSRHRPRSDQVPNSGSCLDALLEIGRCPSGDTRSAARPEALRMPSVRPRLHMVAAHREHIRHSCTDVFLLFARVRRRLVQRQAFGVGVRRKEELMTTHKQNLRAVLRMVDHMLEEWEYINGRQAKRKYRAKLREMGFVRIGLSAPDKETP